MTKAHSSFEVKKWDEETTSELDKDGRLKVTHAAVEFAYSGDVEGQGAMQYLMLYREDGTACVIGLERITGKLAGRNGSFVLQHHGGFAEGVASGDFDVVDGSGSGDLAGLRGKGKAVARKDGSTEFTLDYQLG